MPSISNDELLVEVRNHVAYLTLNRPQALNALSLDMLHAMHTLFEQWAHDPNIYAVVSRGGGEKAYCAGGDVRGLYNSIKGLGPRVQDDFFITEYTLNYQMHRFLKATGKPYLAMIDGIVMGGGMGIAQGATFRIVGERTKMAMPETKIGLFPDVGGTYFLSRATGAIGLYLGLSSNMINGADAMYAKLADAYMTRDAQTALFDGLDAMAWSATPLADVVALVNRLKSEAPPAPIAAFDAAITRHFSGKPNVAAIIASLESASDERTREWAASVAADMRRRSPTLMEVAKRQLEMGHKLGVADCLRKELGMMYRTFEHPDIVEGIRALAIDKDNQPQWTPDRVEAVDPAVVDSFFAARWTPDAHPLAGLEQQFG